MIALQAVLEAELASVLADQVDDGEMALALGAAQAAAELLREQRRRRGRAQQEEAVDVGNVDALAEDLDGEDAAQPPGLQVVESLRPRRLAGRRRSARRSPAQPR